MPKDTELEWFAGVHSVAVDRVDGVPLLRVGAPGPVRAGLIFRVGSADETLPERGLTHLVEHLALHGQLSTTQHQNGATGSTITQFFVHGTQAQVVAFLNDVCAALRDLPTARLETEKSILQIEAQGRRSLPDDRVRSVRYGATALARTMYREIGAEIASVETVTAWAKRWFVRGNVVAWMTTETIPSGPDLRLPDGPRQEWSTPPSVLDHRPVWFAGPAGIVLIESVVERSSAAHLFTSVLNRALLRELRVERGLSYSAGASYEPLDAEKARIVIVADVAPEATAAMLEAVVGMLNSFREGRFAPGDIADARQIARDEQLRLEESPEQRIGSLAIDFLFGGQPWMLDELAAARDAVTEQELAEAARRFWDDAVWQTPIEPTTADGVVAAPPLGGTEVDGEKFINSITREYLVLGDHGVSVIAPGEVVTVLFDECVLAMQYADGGRVLIARAGVGVAIEPSVTMLFTDEHLARIDAAVPPESVARLPARPADQIPTPPRPAPRGLPAWTAPLGFFLTTGAIYNFVRALSTGQIEGGGGVVAAILMFVLGAGLLWGWIRRLRWNRSQKKVRAPH